MVDVSIELLSLAIIINSISRQERETKQSHSFSWKEENLGAIKEIDKRERKNQASYAHIKSQHSTAAQEIAQHLPSSRIIIQAELSLFVDKTTPSSTSTSNTRLVVDTQDAMVIHYLLAHFN